MKEIKAKVVLSKSDVGNIMLFSNKPSETGVTWKLMDVDLRKYSSDEEVELFDEFSYDEIDTGKGHLFLRCLSDGDVYFSKHTHYKFDQVSGLKINLDRIEVSENFRKAVVGVVKKREIEEEFEIKSDMLNLLKKEVDRLNFLLDFQCQEATKNHRELSKDIESNYKNVFDHKYVFGD